MDFFEFVKNMLEKVDQAAKNCTSRMVARARALQILRQNMPKSSLLVTSFSKQDLYKLEKVGLCAGG